MVCELGAEEAMKFGKEFRIHLEETLPGWRDKFLCYKPLKKLIKYFPATATAVDSLPPQLAFFLHPHDPTGRQSVDLQGWFVRILNEELDKFNEFYVDKEEEFVIRFQVPFFLELSMDICICKLFACIYVYIHTSLNWVPCEMGNF